MPPSLRSPLLGETCAWGGKAGEGAEHLRAFRFSSYLIDYDHASDALHALINDLADIPILLYGGEERFDCIESDCPALDLHAHFGSSALGRLLQPTRD